MSLPISKEELANRGKKAEATVAKFFDKLKKESATFDFQRQYDARTARGRFPSQTGDYLVWRKLVQGSRLIGNFSAAIEVKTVAHDFRLPSKNFNSEQIAKLRRRQLAGCLPVVLVFHSTVKLWSCPPFLTFQSEPDAPSWDLTTWGSYATAADALTDASPEIFGAHK
jgi:hypothetical protein